MQCKNPTECTVPGSEQEDLAVPPTPPPSGYSVAGKMQALPELDFGKHLVVIISDDFKTK